MCCDIWIFFIHLPYKHDGCHELPTWHKYRQQPMIAQQILVFGMDMRCYIEGRIYET